LKVGISKTTGIVQRASKDVLDLKDLENTTSNTQGQVLSTFLPSTITIKSPADSSKTINIQKQDNPAGGYL